MKLYPLKFSEIYKKYLWGGEGFEKLGKNVPGKAAAESWEIACHKDGMSVVSNGWLTGKALNDLVKEYKQDLVGINANSEDTFPLLVKFINAKDNLSVQVHPNNEYAQKYEGERGKSEAWVILEAEEDARLIVGLKPEVTKEVLRKSINEHSIEDTLCIVQVSAGDIIDIPAGLVHAVGKGVMLAEVQQNSNSTYRVYDYDRTDKDGNLRKLHIDKALDVINFSNQTERKVYENTTVCGKRSSRTIAIKNEYFCLETFEIDEEIKQTATGETFLIYIFTRGNGYIKYDDSVITVKKGDTYLVPASLGEFAIEGNISFIKSYIPNLQIEENTIEATGNTAHL